MFVVFPYVYMLHCIYRSICHTKDNNNKRMAECSCRVLFFCRHVQCLKQNGAIVNVSGSTWAVIGLNVCCDKVQSTCITKNHSDYTLHTFCLWSRNLPRPILSFTFYYYLQYQWKMCDFELQTNRQADILNVISPCGKSTKNLTQQEINVEKILYYIVLYYYVSFKCTLFNSVTISTDDYLQLTGWLILLIR